VDTEALAACFGPGIEEAFIEELAKRNCPQIALSGHQKT
jgi:hypothetical protein